MITFNPSNWYWRAEDGRIFSSLSVQVVDANDQTFIDWKSAGGAPTIWPRDADGNQTEEALQEVLTPYGLFAGLASYANAVQWAKATGGYAASIGGNNFTISTSPDSMTMISGKAVRLMRPTAPATLKWQVGAKAFVTISKDDFMVLADNVADFVQSTFDTLADVIAGIEAGTITTKAEVEAAFT